MEGDRNLMCLEPINLYIIFSLKQFINYTIITYIYMYLVNILNLK